MAVNTAGIQNGMDVYDSNGDKIGTVDDVLAVEARSETGGGLTSNTLAGDVAGQGSYLKISEGGVLGIGTTELYVPFSAVQNVSPGDSVTINCTKDQCGNMYGNKPEFLGGD